MKNEIKIMLVEDEKEYRDDLAYLINREDGFKVVAELEKGEDAVEMVKRLRSDIVLMDLELAGKMDGIEAIKKIKDIDSSMNIMVLTKFDTDKKLFPALENGAIGYLTKSSSIGKITERIKAVIKGDSPFSPRIARKLTEYVYKNKRSESKIEELCKRENQILHLVAESYTSKEIADKCGISFNTVRTHMRNIYEKLGVKNKIEAINKLKGNYLRD
ncbi:MAG: response regulator, partial [Nitrospinota bacterium]